MEAKMSVVEIEKRRYLASEGAANVAEACQLLGIKRTYLYALMERGDLRFAKIGRRRVVPRAEITRFLADAIVGERK
jgi:excisionase family DNA binding protein